uniref:Uncharacterized protein n=1 Tax=Peronospora matthiolae TaxID=2874970 RepID=A0AAV1SZZ2_9STRA
MFVFEAVGTEALLGLLDVDTKAQAPVDEYVVVAGRVQSSRQLTCLGGRVKHDGKRRLLVVPLAPARDSEAAHGSCVQVLDVGGVAATFLQGVRACFPTLVRKNLMADVDSDSEEEEALKKKHEEEGTADSEAAKDQQSNEEVVLKDMDRIRVQTVMTFDELVSAFPIADPVDVRTSLLNDPSVPKHYQLLCIDCPAVSAADNATHEGASHTFSSPATPSSEPFDFGVLFLSEMAPPRSESSEQLFLQIPVPRSPLRSTSAVHESFQDATVLTFGTKREESVHGGGKTCEEMLWNIRMRHASGTFCTLVVPTTTWEQVVHANKSVLPQVCELQGELRLRRLVGTAPRGEPVKLLLDC